MAEYLILTKETYSDREDATEFPMTYWASAGSEERAVAAAFEHIPPIQKKRIVSVRVIKIKDMKLWDNWK